MEIKSLSEEEIETLINRGPDFTDYLDSVWGEIAKSCDHRETVKYYKEVCITAARLLINNPIT